MGITYLVISQLYQHIYHNLLLLHCGEQGARGGGEGYWDPEADSDEDIWDRMLG